MTPLPTLTQTETVLPLRAAGDTADPARLGGKAATLARLGDAGLPVPDGVEHHQRGAGANRWQHWR